jgi:hypothetical protein
MQVKVIAYPASRKVTKDFVFCFRGNILASPAWHAVAPKYFRTFLRVTSVGQSFSLQLLSDNRHAAIASSMRVTRVKKHGERPGNKPGKSESHDTECCRDESRKSPKRADSGYPRDRDVLRLSCSG